MNSTENTTHALNVEIEHGGVAIVRMDDPNEKVNTLKRELAEEFERLLDDLESRQDIKGLVFTSGKPDSFLAGADLDMLRNISSAAAGTALSRLSQGIQNRLAALPIPTVAAIHGTCLGGGLELALAFDQRIASDNPNTRLGLPEVKLGLLPGGGGTQRLPRLVGVPDALDLLLTGREISAARGSELGLVNEVVPNEDLIETAITRAQARAGKDKQPRSLIRRLCALASRKGAKDWLLGGNPIGRKFLFDQARARTLRKTRGNYPAPERILSVVRTGLEHGMEAGLEAEAQAFGELAQGNVAKELINLFFTTNALKKDSGVEDPTVEPRTVRQVAVLGAGLMGAGIGYVTLVRAATAVCLKDKDAAAAERGLQHIREALEKRVDRGRMSHEERDRVLARLQGTVDYDGLTEVDVVIEAVFEDLELKRRMVKDVENAGRPDVIFASNTSAIPISRIAQASAHPETVIGMHYFSPVEKMPLLEVVVTDETASWVTATCVALGKRQGKTVIVVHDGPGFYTSRTLAPYMNEAAHMLADGVKIDAIDKALVDFGFPIGPFKLLDEVGIDVVEKVGGSLGDALGERLSAPPVVQRLIADQRLGRKNGRGFYRYGTGTDSHQVDETVYAVLGVEPTAPHGAEEIAERCVLQMLNEAAHCLGEGILRSARDGDIGAVFGLGFPPFRGGPFRYADAVGSSQAVARLNHYASRFGARFKPAAVLVALAESGGLFYGEGAMARPLRGFAHKGPSAALPGLGP